MANMNGRKVISRMGVTRGRKPLRSMHDPEGDPAEPDDQHRGDAEDEHLVHPHGVK